MIYTLNSLYKEFQVIIYNFTQTSFAKKIPAHSAKKTLKF